MNIISAPGTLSIDCLPVLVQTLSIMASKFAWSRPPSVSQNSLDYDLQVCMIMASKCISPNWLNHGLKVHLQTCSIAASKLHDHGLQVHLHICMITASTCISNLALSWPPSVSPNSLDYSIQVRMIMASNFISILAQSRPPSASRNSLGHGLKVYLWVHSILICRRTSNCSQAPPAASPDIPSVDG